MAGQSYVAALIIIQPGIDTWVEAATSPNKRSFKLIPEGASR